MWYVVRASFIYCFRYSLRLFYHRHAHLPLLPSQRDPLRYIKGSFLACECRVLTYGWRALVPSRLCCSMGRVLIKPERHARGKQCSLASELVSLCDENCFEGRKTVSACEGIHRLGEAFGLWRPSRGRRQGTSVLKASHTGVLILRNRVLAISGLMPHVCIKLFSFQSICERPINKMDSATRGLVRRGE